MDVSGINHINIVVSAGQFPDVVTFYEQIIGLTQGVRAVSKRNGAWLYCHDTAIIHLSVVEQPPYRGSNGHFNHVALSCSGVAAWVQHLNSHQIRYDVDYRPAPAMTQLFLYDPVGIRIELNFAGEQLDLSAPGA
ncbi:VOC family protein [Methylovulum psychrotolerans]|uniref:VOC family protein n=1 Tax=Methylovulum psychrotolerans TaxID=1704499 RepID=UPI001BFF9C26|nr:VOC family protein [Methylovulum psychrotolerans]MBT9096867.1 VOC family protein [Methylovulum psychrotolerans]